MFDILVSDLDAGQILVGDFRFARQTDNSPLAVLAISTLTAPEGKR
jgi:hypothetical protein